MPNEGQAISYTVTVTNNGPDNATSITVTDQLPAGVTYTGHSTTQGAYAQGTGVWNVGALANSASVTLTLNATVNTGTGGSTITNTATRTASSPTDPTPGNNSDSADITVVEPQADIEVEKTVSNMTPNEGQAITYTVTVTNNGPEDATSVTVTDQLPAGVTYTGHTTTQGTYTSGTGVWNVGTLANSASVTLTLNATVNTGTGGSTITNTATRTTSSPTDPTAGNDSDSADITVVVPRADIEVEKTVSDTAPDEGQAISYTVTVTNNGPEDATSVTVTDQLPAGVTYTGHSTTQGTYTSGTGVWNVGTLANSASVTLTLNATVNTGTGGSTITNTATRTTSSPTDPTAGNDSDDAAMTVNVPQANLSLTKTDSPDPILVGNNLMYTITVNNAGPDAATGVTVTDTLPANVTLISLTPSQGTCVGTTAITCNLGTINSGANATIAIGVATQAQGVLSNTALVTADQDDPAPGNNSDTETTTVYAGPPGAATLVAPSGVIDDATPTYEWNPVSTATQYRLYVMQTGGAVVHDQTYLASNVCTASACMTTPSAALNNGEYDWWVRTYNASGWGQWSSAMHFTVNVPAPGAATLTYPTGNIGADNQPTYQWSDVANATWYQLYVSGPNSYVFNGWVQDANVCNGTTCSHDIGDVLANGAHTWYVRTYGPGGYGPWSPGMAFFVGDPLPPAPMPQQPTGTITDASPAFSWQEAQYATHYRLYLEGTAGAVLNQLYTVSSEVTCTGGVCTVDPGLALNNGAYQWWVQGSNATGNGPWSAPADFTVAIPAPGAATLTYPTGNIGADNQPTYQWNDVQHATHYQLYVSGPGGYLFNGWVQDAAVCNGATCSHSTGATLANGAHTWYVRTWSPGGYGPWSGGMDFFVGDPLPPAPTPQQPTGAITDPSPAFSWQEAQYATQYRLYVEGAAGSVLNQLYTVGAEVTCASGVCTVDPGLTLANGAYAWWVQGSNATGRGPWSAQADFTVAVPTPGAATLTYPTGNIGANNQPTYQWSDVEHATWYRVYVTGPGGYLHDAWVMDAAACAGGGCTYDAGHTLANGAYQWWVRTWNPAGNGPWSAAMDFFVGDPLPPAPTPQQPTGTLYQNAPAFQWSEAQYATHYRLYVEGTAGSVLNQLYTAGVEVTCTAGVCTVDPGLALADGAYAWWVQASNATGRGPWSARADFTIDAVPDAPVPQQPVGTITDTSPTYTWSELPNATHYELYV
ncbi:MAG: DUF11 domain-containing protein [Anaerolineae bacterium]|nr:DUF11 domain-containing protein [Anaerolineae bacterium]